LILYKLITTNHLAR